MTIVEAQPQPELVRRATDLVDLAVRRDRAAKQR